MKTINLLKKVGLIILIIIPLSYGTIFAQTTIFDEDFSDGELPADWTTSGTGSWVVEEDFNCWGGTGISDYSIGACAGTTARNTDLITKEFDLSGYVNVELSFYHRFRQSDPATGTLSYSIGGGSWNQINLWNSNMGEPATYTINLSDELDGESGVKLKWNFTSGSYNYYWNIGSITLTGDPAAPGNIAFYNSGSTSQLAFNNSYINTNEPIFRVSATHEDPFDAFEIEINTASDFTGTSYTQTFSGAYTSGAEYDLECDGLSSALPTTNNITYYVRARASEDGGTEWGNWSSETYSFTYKDDGFVEWYQTEDEQFATGSFSGGSLEYGETGTSGGMVGAGWSNYPIFMPVSVTESGNLEFLSVHLAAAAGDIKLALYEAGGAQDLVAHTNSTAAVPGWNNLEPTSTVTISAGDYWIAINTNNDGSRYSYEAASGSGGYYASRAFTSDWWDNLPGSGGGEDRGISLKLTLSDDDEITSSPINISSFLDATSWTEVSWGGSGTIEVGVYADASASTELIAPTSSSPIDISGIDTDGNPTLYLKAILDEGDELDWWKVSAIEPPDEVDATRLVFHTQPSSSVCVNTNLETYPVVRALDDDGHVDTDFTGTITLTNSEGLSMTGHSVAAVNGVASFTDLQFTESGNAGELSTTNTEDPELDNATTTVEVNVLGEPEEVTFTSPDITVSSITWNWEELDYAEHYETKFEDEDFENNGLALNYEKSELSVNQEYSLRVRAYLCETTGDETQSLVYTAANVPGAPSLNTLSSSSISLEIDVNDNPEHTEFAIYCVEEEEWVQTDGSLDGTEAWQTNAEWGTVEVTGLTQSTEYTFQLKARNGNNVETGLGAGASEVTDCDVIELNTCPWVEDFSSTSTTRDCWTQEYIEGTADWTFVTNGASGGSINSPYEGDENARFVSSSNSTTKLISPVLDLSLVGKYELSFWYGQEVWFGDINELKVYYRISNLDPWVEIAHYTANITSWTQETLELPNTSASYQIAFEGISNGGRRNVLDKITITPIIECPGDISVCINEDAFELDGAEIVGGDYSGAGVEDNEFDPSVAGEGTHTITYTIIEAECESTCSFSITVDDVPEINALSADDICHENDAVFTISGTPESSFKYEINDGGELVQTFDGEGNVEISIANATENQNINIYEISYGACTDTDIDMDETITVHAYPDVPTCPVSFSVCTNDNEIDLFSLAGLDPINGEFTLDGDVITHFNPATAGVDDHTIIYTVSENNCESTCSFVITVNDLPDEPTCPASFSVCIYDDEIDLFDLAELDPVDGEFSLEGSVITDFDPDVEGLGEHTIIYTVTENGCENTCSFNITVNDLPDEPTCPEPLQICLNDNPIDLFSLANLDPIDGVFTLGEDVITEFDPEAEGDGTHTITYTVSEDNCENTCSFDISVSTLPLVDEIANVTEVDEYVLPILTNGNYFTETNGGGDPLTAGDEITENKTIYIFNEADTEPFCTNESSFTVTIITYEIVLKDADDIITSYDFGSVIEAYNPIDEKVITIERAGTENIENLELNLSGDNADSYTVTNPLETTLDDDNESTTFTVKPNDDLLPGTYTAIVTVSADNDVEEILNLEFVVNPSYEISIKDGDTEITDGIYDFGIAEEAYEPYTEKEFIIERLTSGIIENLEVNLSGTNADSFTITNPTETTLNDDNQTTTFTLKPNNDLTEGLYSATVTVTADNDVEESFDVHFEVIDEFTYEIVLKDDDIIIDDTYTFEPQDEGYTPVDALEVTIEKTGTGIIENLAVALSGDNADSYEITNPAETSLDLNNTTTSFTIKPNDDLVAGTYVATLTVSADNNVEESINIEFHVNPHPCAAITSFPWNENFNDGEISDCWDIQDDAGDDKVWIITSSLACSGDNLNMDGYFAGICAAGAATSTDSDLISPIFDFSNKQNVTISFDHYYKHWSGQTGTLSYSTNNGDTWTVHETWTGYANNHVIEENYEATINNLDGETDVKFKWNLTGSDTWYWGIDNIQISAEIETYTVTFAVQDEDENPITNAEILLGSTQNTEGDYVFEDVEVGTYNYLVEADGYEDNTGTVQVIDDDLTVTITMIEGTVQSETYAVTFVVQDEDENPITNAEILLDTIQNIAGDYVFEDIEVGTYNYVVEADGFENYNGTLEVIDENLTITVTMIEEVITPDTYTVTFIVRDEDGDPITNAEILLDTIQNNAGEYIFEDIEVGTYNYLVEADGYEDYNGTLEVVDENITITVTLIEEPILPDTYTVTFVVRDEDGDPITNAEILLGTTQNTAGDYVFENIEPGSHTYLVSANNYDDYTGTAQVVDQNITIAVTLIEESVQPDTYSVSFIVQDEDQNPITNAQIQLGSIQNPVGDYVFEDLEPGTYSYTVSADNYEEETGEAVLSNENLTITVTLTEEDIIGDLHHVIFYVRNTSNQAVEGASVSIAGQEDLITNNNGVAMLELPDGVYSYEVSAEDYVTITDEEFTVDGQNTQINVFLEYADVHVYTDELPKFSIYPNPNHARFYLVYENVDAKFNYTIYDIKGRVIVSNSIADSHLKKQEIVLEAEPGVYFIRIENSQFSTVQQFIVQ